MNDDDFDPARSGGITKDVAALARAKRVTPAQLRKRHAAAWDALVNEVIEAKASVVRAMADYSVASMAHAETVVRSRMETGDFAALLASTAEAERAAKDSLTAARSLVIRAQERMKAGVDTEAL